MNHYSYKKFYIGDIEYDTDSDMVVEDDKSTKGSGIFIMALIALTILVVAAIFYMRRNNNDYPQISNGDYKNGY